MPVEEKRGGWKRSLLSGQDLENALNNHITELNVQVKAVFDTARGIMAYSKEKSPFIDTSMRELYESVDAYRKSVNDLAQRLKSVDIKNFKADIADKRKKLVQAIEKVENNLNLKDVMNFEVTPVPEKKGN